MMKETGNHTVAGFMSECIVFLAQEEMAQQYAQHCVKAAIKTKDCFP
ncbi:MAG: hypothetical protein IJU96_03405 [Clostridia bacterium]|nr:hypothetical protein [Clostridia bacterium]